MKLPRRVKRVAVFAIAFVAGLWVADRMLDARPLASPTTAPSTQTSIDPAAKTVVEKLIAAYAKRPLSVKGTLAIDFDVAGMKEQRTSKFVGSALSSKQFKHEIEGEVKIVGDADAIHVLDLKQNQYITNKIEKDGSKSDELVTAMLSEQNPALLFAISDNPQDALFAKGTTLSLDAASNSEFDVLLAEQDSVSKRYYVKKESGLIDHIDLDFTALIEKQGGREVKSASAKLQYDKVDFESPLDATAFAFKPPADAVEATNESRELLVAGGDAKKLEGQTAPAFELMDVDGKAVSLESLKGKVVVLDFWATWCGPCRASLPKIDALAKEYADRGVATFAVNVGEDGPTVSAFMTEQKFSLTALLDTDSAVSKKYLVTGIPQTVVIGPDGVVRFAHIGASPDLKEELAKQIEAALK